MLRVLIGSVVLFGRGPTMAEGRSRRPASCARAGNMKVRTALGLGYWRMMGYVIMPQALKQRPFGPSSIPSSHCSKDTHAGVADRMSILRPARAACVPPSPTPNWATAG